MDGLKQVFTPTGLAIIGLIVMYWTFEARVEKQVEKRIKQEVHTAVQIEALNKVQEQHKEKIWVMEGEISSLKSHNHAE